MKVIIRGVLLLPDDAVTLFNSPSVRDRGKQFITTIEVGKLGNKIGTEFTFVSYMCIS